MVFTVPDSAPLGSGAHDYTLTFTDKFGTETTHTATVTISTLVGYLSPEDDTGVVGDNQTQNTSPSLTGKASIGATLRIEFNAQEYTIPLNADGTGRLHYRERRSLKGISLQTDRDYRTRRHNL